MRQLSSPGPVSRPPARSCHKGYRLRADPLDSLFRLYRSLGGDTDLRQRAPAVERRGRCRRAADYTAYLIMRAIAWLGPINWVAAETPDQFVSALIDADVGPCDRSRAGPPAPALPRTRRRLRAQGGALGVRGAGPLRDERPPTSSTRPASRRRSTSSSTTGAERARPTAHAAGAYTPVPLDWSRSDIADARAWHGGRDMRSRSTAPAT